MNERFAEGTCQVFEMNARALFWTIESIVKPAKRSVSESMRS